MPLRLVSNLVDGIPPLSWAASLPRSGDTMTVQHGNLVDEFPEGFFEGAWDGEYAKGGYARATNVFGSGGMLQGDGMLFVGPSNTLEPLYIVEQGAETVVSNSLAFALRKTRVAFDLRTAGYGLAFSEIVHGLEHTPQVIELEGGRLTLLYHHNALLRPGHPPTVLPKPLPPSFASFDEYRGYLQRAVAAAFENACALGRRFRYRPIATISSGYDSAAAAVIARDCGCAESLSLSTSSVGGPDSGKAIATALGMTHTDFERVSAAAGDPLLEAEFLATGMQGEDYVYAVFGERIAGRFLVTGFQGGNVWSSTDPPNPQIKRTDLSGCSLGEFRLRTNFLHLPLAYIGIQRHPDIRRISNGPDMRSYMIRRSYDRPLPRRILEGAGVDRGLFARRKQGASILLFQGRNRLSVAALTSVTDYCRRESGPSYALRLALRQAWWTFGRSLYGVVRRLGRGLGIDRRGRLSQSLAALARRLFGLEYPVFGASHPRFTLLLMWAIAMVQPRYAPSDAGLNAARAREIA